MRSNGEGRQVIEKKKDLEIKTHWIAQRLVKKCIRIQSIVTCILAIVKEMNDWFQLTFKWACE
jgi:hypothetical protein